MMLQLNPTLIVYTPKGKAMAIGWIDYGPEHDLLWVCFQNDTGECWTWNNTQIKCEQNITYDRKFK